MLGEADDVGDGDAVINVAVSRSLKASALEGQRVVVADDDRVIFYGMLAEHY